MAKIFAGLIFGVMIGLIGFLVFTDTIRETDRGELIRRKVLFLLGILGGGSLIGLPISRFVFSESIIAWWLIGEGIGFVLLATLVILRKFII